MEARLSVETGLIVESEAILVDTQGTPHAKLYVSRHLMLIAMSVPTRMYTVCHDQPWCQSDQHYLLKAHRRCTTGKACPEG